MRVRPDEAKPNSPIRRRGATALLAALALLAASALLAAPAAAGPRRGAPLGPRASASVIGGHNATIAEFPSLAFIEGVQATAGYACTGTVVAPRVVLTAGHCVEDIESSSIVEPNLIAVATGVSNLRHIPRARVSQVERVLAYPGFNPTKLHGDAGLLILTAPVDVPPVALAGSADAALYDPGDKLTIAGWGIDDRATGHAPDQLQSATVPVVRASRCRKGTRRFYPFFEPARQVCALDAPRFHITTCHGDSGGPALARRADGSLVEIGVTSLGNGTCNPASPAVFTRVDQISTWVSRWIDAVEVGAPLPRIRIPKAHIPVLTRARAEELTSVVSDEAFGPRFRHGRERTIHCHRLAKARLRCDVTWYQGPSDYFGQVTVFFAIHHNVVLAGAHYAIHWVNNRCYFHSGHPRACPVRTKRK